MAEESEGDSASASVPASVASNEMCGKVSRSLNSIEQEDDDDDLPSDQPSLKENSTVMEALKRSMTN